MGLNGTIDYLLQNIACGWFKTSIDVSKLIFTITDQDQQVVIYPDISSSPKSDNSTFLFKIILPEGFSPNKLIDGSLTIQVNAEERYFTLRVWSVLRLAYDINSLNESNFDDLNKWLNVLSSNLRKIGVKTSIASQDVETPNRYGDISPDGDVEVGHNGILFLGQGTNKVKELYTDNYLHLVPRWLDLIQRREDFVNRLGLRYIQLIIPEKSSVLYPFSPFITNGCSQLLHAIAKSHSPSLLIPFYECNSHTRVSHSYLQRDSHLSTEGAYLAFNMFLLKLGLSCSTSGFKEKHIQLSGDLGKKFSSFDKELVLVYEEAMSNGAPVLINEHIPESGHKGITRTWVNDFAPYNMKVVAFANSFFERGSISTQLSWWFSRFFKEFTFIWSPSMDYSYVAREMPDIVICQTVERFLRVLPTDQVDY